MDKQIEELTDLIDSFNIRTIKQAKYVAEYIVDKLNYRKIPESAVVIPKEVSCYDNVEERIRTFNLDGNKVDFTDEQIMALTTIFHHIKLQEKEIRKETAEKFAEKVLALFPSDMKITTVSRWTILRICKEITESK